MLPVAQYQTNENPAVAQASDNAARRILVVDDDEYVRSMFAAFLSENYTCVTAASSDEALSELTRNSYGLVISDIQMPGRNGVELLREIRQRYPDTAVIMISGIARAQRIRDALQLGALDYLVKPIELDVLSFAVERALARRALTLTARRYRADLERQNIELSERKAELERLQAQIVHSEKMAGLGQLGAGRAHDDTPERTTTKHKKTNAHPNRLQAQIVHSEKMAGLGQLAAGIAHELNNPAGFVYGNMDLIRGYLGRLELILTIYERTKLPQPEAAQ